MMFHSCLPEKTGRNHDVSLLSTSEGIMFDSYLPEEAAQNYNVLLCCIFGNCDMRMAILSMDVACKSVEEL